MDVVRVQADDFSLAEEYRQTQQAVGAQCGAVATFVGLVREKAGDDDVATLELEHYPGMTEASIETILTKARTRWELQHIRVIHRIGKLKAASQIVLVIVASSHRPDAFAACEFIMDYLKTEAVFWKKEQRTSGETWIESTSQDYQRRSVWAEKT